MDLSLTTDFDSSLLNWDEDDDDCMPNSGGAGAAPGSVDSDAAPAASSVVGVSDVASSTRNINETSVPGSDMGTSASSTVEKSDGASQPASSTSGVEGQSGSSGTANAGAVPKLAPSFMRLPSFSLGVPPSGDSGSSEGKTAQNQVPPTSSTTAVAPDYHAQMEAAMASINRHGFPFLNNAALAGQGSSAAEPFPPLLGLSVGTNQTQATGGDQQAEPSTSADSATLPQHLLLQHPTQTQPPPPHTTDHGASAAAAAAAVAAVYSPHYTLPNVSAPPQALGVSSGNSSRRNAGRPNTSALPALVSTSSGLGTINNAGGTGATQVKASSSALPMPVSAQHQEQYKRQAGQMHPLAMPSSSNCPPHVVAAPPPSKSPSGQGAQGGTVLPVVFNPLATPVGQPHFPNVGPTEVMAMFQQSQQFHAAPAAQIQQQQLPPAPAQKQPPAQKQTGTTSAPPKCTATKQEQKQKQAVKKKDEQQQPAPPFLLFDAPCELRTNFLQSQRMHNIPVAPDNNAYHYGMAVNGFHPQLNAQVNPIMPISSFGAVHGMAPLGSSVQLIDGRHKSKKGSGKERNEREQRRAQKITELIESLRLSMVKGGWKVEMKSKYHTLSTCADYVKHLIKVTDEKEAAVEQAKSDLTIREHKLEEEKTLQESRSDPESVTSSLTASTSGSGPCSGSDKEPLDRMRNECDSGGEGERKIEEEENDECCERNKKVALDKRNSKGSDDGTSSADSSGEEGGSSSGPGGKNISLDKMSSSVSDMTDSNRSSSDGGTNCRKTSKVKKDHRLRGQFGEYAEDDTGARGLPSSSSISSTAAVVRGGGSQGMVHHHSDVVIMEKDISRAKDRKRKHRRERSSVERDFDLDYKEVFLTSNVPQLIATPAGRIVTWNNFFLKATGLSEEEARHLTIFSIVQADHLSSLFEMVASALRKSSFRKPTDSDSRKTSSSGDTDKESHSTRLLRDQANGKRESDYDSVTLPCISFPASEPKAAVATMHHPNPLYMTVTLMSDEDPRKRCFHCVLTDSPGTNGSLGSVTAELLALLFEEHCVSAKDAKADTTKKHRRKKPCLEKTHEKSDENMDDTNSCA